MRIGLIGLGRIGAFHADTLVGIPAIESLVVTDLVPDRTKQVVDRHQGDGGSGSSVVDRTVVIRPSSPPTTAARAAAMAASYRR